MQMMNVNETQNMKNETPDVVASELLSHKTQDQTQRQKWWEENKKNFFFGGVGWGTKLEGDMWGSAGSRKGMQMGYLLISLSGGYSYTLLVSDWSLQGILAKSNYTKV